MRKMDEKNKAAERDKLKRVINKLNQTRTGGTVCLADWEVRLLLNLIHRQQHKIKALKAIL